MPPPPAAYAPMGGGYPGYAGYAGARTDGLAIGSLIVGILSLVCSIACLGLFLGPAAAIMGFVSRQRVSSSGGMLAGGGLAIAGLILGIVGFLASVAWFFLFGVAFIKGATAGPTPSP